MARLNSALEQGQNIDSLRRKFGAQNRAMAKSSANLREKIIQLEQRISDLLKENLDLKYDNLRLTKCLAENTTKSPNDMLQQQFSQVRGLLDAKYKEMQEIIAIGFNVDADATKEEAGKTTSFTMSGKRSSQSRLSSCIDEVTESSLTQPTPKQRDILDDHITSTSTAVSKRILSPTPGKIASPSIFAIKSLEIVSSPKITKKTVKKSKRQPLTVQSPNKKIEIKSPVTKPSNRRTTRVKEVNYALPSLRTKMRRPTEKLVDAVQEDKEN